MYSREVPQIWRWWVNALEVGGWGGQYSKNTLKGEGVGPIWPPSSYGCAAPVCTVLLVMYEESSKTYRYNLIIQYAGYQENTIETQSKLYDAFTNRWIASLRLSFLYHIRLIDQYRRISNIKIGCLISLYYPLTSR